MFAWWNSVLRSVGVVGVVTAWPDRSHGGSVFHPICHGTWHSYKDVTPSIWCTYLYFFLSSSSLVRYLSTTSDYSCPTLEIYVLRQVLALILGISSGDFSRLSGWLKKDDFMDSKREIRTPRYGAIRLSAALLKHCVDGDERRHCWR